jgi:ribosomal protein L29
MKTRHCGIYIVGYYEKLNALSTADLYEENREKKKELTLRSKGQKSFANSVNKFIIKALKRNYKTEKENRWAKEAFEISKPW